MSDEKKVVQNMMHVSYSSMDLLSADGRLNQCNELPNNCDENDSQNFIKCDVNSYNKLVPSNCRKIFMSHSAPLLDVKDEPIKESELCLKNTMPNKFQFDLKSMSPSKNSDETSNTFIFSLNSPLPTTLENEDYYTPKTSYNSQVSSDKSDLFESLNLSSSYSTNSSACDEEYTDYFDSRTDSCEFYSAKSSVRTPYDYMKSPEVNLSPTYNSSSITRSEEDNSSTINIENLNIEASTIINRRTRLKSILASVASSNNVDLSASKDKLTESNENINKCKKLRNLKSLTLNLDYVDETLQQNNMFIDNVLKTPTFTQSKQKANSLDSSDSFTPLVKLSKSNASSYHTSSVPNTPKKIGKKIMKPLNSIKSIYHNCDSTSLNIPGESSSTLRSCNQRFSHYSLSRSKINNLEETYLNNKIRDQHVLLGASGLHHFKNSLSMSSNNLKTLPEIMPLSDFNESDMLLVHEQIIDESDIPSRKNILQRRGSNQSLTLNLDSNLKRSECMSLRGSANNLTRSHGLSASNCSIYEHSDNYPKKSKYLLHGRVFNQNLTVLNFNNRFSSQSLMGIDNSFSYNNNKKGLLERRNSNTSLTLNLSTSSQSAFSHWITDMEPTDDSLSQGSLFAEGSHASKYSSHRKSISTECLLENFPNCDDAFQFLSNNYGSVDNLVNDEYRCKNFKSTCCGFGDEPVRLITTRPLSPEADSEDIRTHLANLDILQNASNVLCRRKLRELQALFEFRYQLSTHEDYRLPTSEMGPDRSDAFSIITDKENADKKTNLETDIHSSINSMNDTLFTAPAVQVVNSLEQQKKCLFLKLHKEFWSLPNNFQDKPIVYGSQNKNRYKSILPNEHSRVILDEKTPCNIEGYINANYIKEYDNSVEAYIVTQGPLSHTTYDFWSMVYQNFSNFLKKKDNYHSDNVTKLNNSSRNRNYQKIIMLTDLAESNYQKCSPYFPSHNGDSMTFYFDSNNFILKNDLRKQSEVKYNNGKNSAYEVLNTGVIFKRGYSLRRLFVKRINLQNGMEIQDYIEIFHYWFEGWPDHKSPDDVHVLLDMCLHILDADCSSEFPSSDCFINLDKTQISIDETKNKISDLLTEEICQNSAPLPIIHCSAGIGRTGCLVAILNGVKQLRKTEKVDILRIVSSMRLSRGGMVQNSEQYELVYRAMCAYEQKLSQNEDIAK